MASIEPRDHRRDLMIGVGSAAAAAGAIEAYHRIQSRDVADGKSTRFERPAIYQGRSNGDQNTQL